MPAGRPTAYKPEFCEAVIDAGREGKTKAEMAAVIDVDRETLNEWMKVHPEFSRAVKRGLDYAQAWWEEKGRQATFGNVPNFNATSFIFNMKNRFSEDWRDKHDVEHSGGVAINVIDSFAADT